MSINNINYIELKEVVEGKERVMEILNMPFEDNTFIPKTVTYKDIDSAVKKWLNDEIKIVSEDGKLFPTMSLFSNQRFSEYAQSWRYTDNNNNLLLNFKTVLRDNNPQYGSIQNKYYNIPGEVFFTVYKKKVLDDNGCEYIRSLKMRQPLTVDIVYKISIFTNKYEVLNEFNTKINRLFSSRQTYISPNGYYMPMILEGVNDDSEYKIDDRQFYSQSATIKVLAFILDEEDFRVEESPLKFTVNIDGFGRNRKKPEAEIEECEHVNSFYHKPIVLTLSYPVCKTNKCSFKIDVDFVCTEIDLGKNIQNNYVITINGDKIDNILPFKFNTNDEITISIKKKLLDKEAIMVLKGYDDNIIYDENLDNPEIEKDNTQKVSSYDIIS